jgi:hypothetical protein
MIGLANQYNALSYHLQVVRGGLNNSKREKIDSFIRAIHNDLLNNDIHLPSAIDEKFSIILDLRIAALKLLSSEGKDFNELLDNDVYPYFEKLIEVDRLSNLADNILFALRCNKKVISYLISKIEPEEQSFDGININNFPDEISYDQFISTIYLISPTVEAANTFIEFSKCSFRIEYVICAAAMIFDDTLMVTPQKINELSSIIVNAAQIYSAIAMELEWLPLKVETRQHPTDIIVDPDFLEEQKKLAEAGIQLFSKIWNS